MRPPAVAAALAIALLATAGPLSAQSGLEAVDTSPGSGVVAYNVSPGIGGVATPASEPDDYVSGRVIVRFRDDVQVDAARGTTSVEALNVIARTAGVRQVRPLLAPEGTDHARRAIAGLHQVYVLDYSGPVDVELLAAAYSARPEVLYAEPDRFLYLDVDPPGGTVPDDPMYLDQWGLNNTGQAIPHTGGGTVGTPGSDINAELAWDIEVGSSSVSIAILDTGVDLNHPEFAGKLLPGWDFIDNNDDPTPTGNAHGTAAAGIAAAAGNNGIGVAGVAWGVQIIPIRVCATNTCSTSAIASGISWAADQGASVISMSLGGPSLSQLIADAITYAYDAGVVVLASTGNENTSSPRYPASLPNVISVGALSPCNTRKTPTSCDGETWWGSSFGAGMDFLAPGTRIHTTDILGAGGYTNGDYTATFNGTSAACPFAAGVAALLLSANPDLTPAEVRAIMQSTAVDMGSPGYNDDTGYGRLDAYAALRWGSLVPVAEARSQGAGAAVMVQGVVTRAQGTLTYFQDHTGGLAIRQGAGTDFHEDVAAGTITNGTFIRLSGTLSLTDGVLKFDTGDLDEYEVVAQATGPAPQEITLDQLVGDDYQAEIVRIRNAVFQGASGTFESGTDYAVTDASIAPATAVLRVPDGASNTIAGSPIPEGAFTFTGVVGSAVGLVAIHDADVQVVELAFSPSLEHGLELAAATGSTAQGPITLTNTGYDELFFRFSQYDDDGRALANAADPLAHLTGAAYPETVKGVDADHPVHLPSRGEGGPDEFGYTWIDSDEPGGPAFEDIDIAATGTARTMVQAPGCSYSASDEGFALVDLPFSFSYYGEAHDQVWVSANGFVALQPIQGCTFSVGQIPSATSPTSSAPGALIAPLWADLNGSLATSNVHTEQLADGRFVIQWTNWPRYTQSTPNTFQLILYPGGTIKVQYLDLQGGFTTSTRIGQQDHAGTDGLLIASGSGYAAAGKAILISSSPLFVTGVSPATGSIVPGESVDAMVYVDAADLPEGNFAGALMIETSETPLTDRDGPVFTTLYQYPVRLEVAQSSEPQAAIDPSYVEFGMPSGATANQVVVLSNTAAVSDDLEYTVSVTSADRIGPSGRDQAIASLSGAEDRWMYGSSRGLLEAISVDPAAGSVPAGSSHELTITADTEGLEDGEYGFMVVIETNDPQNDTLLVEVLLLVADGELEFDPPIETGLEVTVEAGDSGDGTITLTNNTSSEIAFTFPQYAAAARATAGDQALHLPKGAGDPRAGVAPRDQGGPDGFGHSWIDSNEPGGPAFEWFDISGVGDELSELTGTWDGNVAVTLPFGFEFYGETHMQAQVSVNGWINFDLHTGGAWANQPIPTAEPPSNFIAPFWDDLDMRTSGVVHTFHDADNGRFVIQWTGVQQDGAGSLTFQAQLFAAGPIMFQYDDMDGTLTSATVGIEAPSGADGLQVVFNAPYVEDELAVLISSAPSFVTDVAPAAGTIAAGGSTDIVVSFEAGGLFAGTYEGALSIETDEPEGSAYSYPVRLVVEGEAGCAVSPDLIAFGEVIIGLEATIEVSVANDGAAVCTLTEVSATHDDFAADFDGEATISPGQSTSFQVSFAPTSAGSATGSLVLTIDGDEVTAALSGTGLAAPQAALDAVEITIVLAPDQTGSGVVTLSNTAAEGASDLQFYAWLDLAESVLIDFEDGQKPPEFTLGNPANFVATQGGNPGHWLRNSSLATFAPQLYIGSSPESPFLGNFVERDVQTISVDAQTVSAPFGVVDRPFSIILTHYSGQPGNVEEHVYVYYTGPLAPQVGEGWSEYVFEIPSDYTGTLPESWHGGHYGDPESLPPGVVWQDILSEVDEVGLMWGHPAFFYLLQDFDLGVDNVGVVFGGMEEAPVWADPAEGSVAAGASQELAIHVDTADFETGTYVYEVLIETNDPANPVLMVEVTVVVEGVGAEGDALPAVFALDQNYPNPFSAETTIEFALPQATAVSVEVFDLTGRRVATLVDAELEAGRHAAVWQTNGVASGVYLYRIQAGSYTRTLRALVVR